jgi:Protease inhibitor Inh
MKHGFLARVIVSATASMLSACNSSDALYAQGPWGPSHIHRNYPEYSAPWGRRQVAPSQAMTGPVVASIDGADITSNRPSPGLHSSPVEPDRPIRTVSPRTGYEPDLGPVSAPAAAPAMIESPPSPASHAGLPEQASPPGTFAAPHRASSYAGTWKATVGSTTCRVQLSSTPSLDLYKASPQGCSDNTLRQVNGWSFRDGQIVLFSRGEVVARLTGAEAALEGAVSGSRTPLKMSR